MIKINRLFINKKRFVMKKVLFVFAGVFILFAFLIDNWILYFWALTYNIKFFLFNFLNLHFFWRLFLFLTFWFFFTILVMSIIIILICYRVFHFRHVILKKLFILFIFILLIYHFCLFFIVFPLKILIFPKKGDEKSSTILIMR